MGVYDLILGPLLVGIMFNTFMFGLVTSQFITYCHSTYKEPLAVKCMVIFLFSLVTMHSAGVIWMVWAYMVDGYGKPETLLVALWPYSFTPIVSAVTSFLTQLFLAWRVFMLSKSKLLYAVIICLALGSCTMGVVCGIKAWILKYLYKMVMLKWLSLSWLVMQVSSDVFVTGSLGILLTRSRTRTNLRLNAILNHLILGAIQTGLFAGVFSIAVLITFINWPQTNLYGMFAIPVAPIYLNTLLSTLNSRGELRHQLSGMIFVDSKMGISNTLHLPTGSSRDSSRQATDTTFSILPTDAESHKDAAILAEEGKGTSRLDSLNTTHQSIPQ